MFEFEILEVVKLVRLPLETAALGIPLGETGTVMGRNYDERFGCEEYQVFFPQATCWIKQNKIKRVLASVS